MDLTAARAPEPPAWLRRAGAVFTPPESVTGSYESMQNVGLRLQAMLATAALAAIWLASGLTSTERAEVTGLLVVFVAYTYTSAKASRDRPILRLTTFVTDLLALFAFAFVVPATLVAVLFAAFLTITFHTYTCGRAAGLVLSCIVMTLAVGAELTAPAVHRLEWFTLLIYGVMLGILTLMVDGLARERRREARHLARLHRALRSLAPAPGLDATLRSVSEAVREAVDAKFVVVMMNEEETLDISVVDGLADDEQDPDMTTDQRRRARRDAEHSPSGMALATGQPVVVADMFTDTRFAQWREEAARWGFRGMVVVPLGPSERPSGVLNTYFASENEFCDDDVVLIVAYAQQASLVIDRAVAYEQQRLAADQLQEADDLKSEFVSTVSHELRTPLTAVRGFVATLLAKWDQIDEDERRFLLERVDWNARELGDLIEGILDFSRIDAGAVSLDVADVEVNALIAALVDRLTPALGGIEVRLDVPPGIRVRADGGALERIVTNLLTNAAKFSPPDTQVDVMARRAGGEVIITVRDRGSGIAPEDQEHVFERFYRAAPAAGKRGTGIGLAIVRSYVESLGGRVWIESAPGEGATFSVALPTSRLEAIATESR